MSRMEESYTCECDDCLGSDTPCHDDCDYEYACQGCQEAFEVAAEQIFDTDCALGRI